MKRPTSKQNYSTIPFINMGMFVCVYVCDCVCVSLCVIVYVSVIVHGCEYIVYSMSKWVHLCVRDCDIYCVWEHVWECESACVFLVCVCVLFFLFFVYIFQKVFIMSMHFFLIRDNHEGLPQGEGNVNTHRTLQP